MMMAEKPSSLGKNISEALHLAEFYAGRYSESSLDIRIKELRNLRERRNKLEGEVKEIDIREILLEEMPDVLEYLVVRDKIAMAILYAVREKGGKFPYRQLG